MSKLQPLSPLQHGVPIVDSKGGPAQQFQRLFNNVWGNLQTLLSAANGAQATADAAVPQTRQIISGNGLTGGGPLTADLTLAVGAGVGVAVAADSVSVESAKEWAANFTADGNLYIPAVVAMTISQGNAAIGTGTITFLKSTSGAPSTFSSTSLPATLQAGAWLKVAAVSVSGFCATHLVRTA